MKPAVFLDRDGTINEQMGYINHLSRIHLLPKATEAIRLLNKHGILAIVVSNQSGIARGYFPMELVESVNARMCASLEEADAKIDGVFYCPHHKNGVIPDYSIDCECRKPKTGLIERACKEFDIDMSKSYVIGDQCSDMELAHRAHLGSVLVKTGYGLGEIEYVLPKEAQKPAYIAEDILDGVTWILGDLRV